MLATLRRHPGTVLLPSALALLFTAGSLAAQAPVPLGRPDATHPEPFSQIRGVRELADGRLLVTDWIEQRLILLDASLARATAVGRTGSGPGEYRLPAALLPMAGDSTLLVDMGNARLAVIAPAGRIARTIPADRPGLGSPLGVDDRGGIYFLLPVWAREGSRLPPDSIEVARMEAASGRITPVAVIKGSTPPARQGPRLTPGFPMVAFAPQDAARVLPSGELLVVRSGDYRIERLTTGGTRAGPSYRYAPEPVRPTDRVAFVREFNARSPMSGRGPDGGMGHSPQLTDAQVAQMVETNEFAAALPPFERVLVAPDGEVWVQRGRHAGDPAIWDRFTPDGSRIGQVRVDRGRQVVAVGRRHLYVAAADEDGIETLERYARPR